MLPLAKNSRILIVVAHPDDELLGVGGTIHHCVHTLGCTVRVVILGEGLTARQDQRDTQAFADELETHHRHITDAQAILGYQELSVHHFPNNRFDSVALLDIVKVIESEKADFVPEVILTHHGGDLNIDHQRTFEAVMTATRPLEDESVCAIMSFETPSATQWQAESDPRRFAPNYFLALSEADIQAKLVAMSCYKFETRPFPHPRSTEALRHLAAWRGASVGRALAEAFMLIRGVF